MHIKCLVQYQVLQVLVLSLLNRLINLGIFLPQLPINLYGTWEQPSLILRLRPPLMEYRKFQVMIQLDNKEKMCNELELNHVLDREVSHLSGGELQRFAIAMSCIQRADV
jgi:ABC-type uncharacterized transport system ATPase subunit